MDYPVVTGDLVVGGASADKAVFSDSGRRLVQEGSKIQGDPAALADMTDMLAQNARNHGGKPLPESPKAKGGKRTRAKTAASHVPQDNGAFAAFVALPREPEPVEKVTVTFENDFGKIKMKALSVIEHDLALALLFETEDDIVFEPKISETLTFHDQNRRIFQVYYPGVTFDMPNSLEKLMILFKMED